jgi:hypothetical protein
MNGRAVNVFTIIFVVVFCSCLVQENKDPESVRRKAMQDPEVQQIITDPAMQMILQQMQKDPQALRE